MNPFASESCYNPIAGGLTGRSRMYSFDSEGVYFNNENCFLESFKQSNVFMSEKSIDAKFSNSKCAEKYAESFGCEKPPIIAQGTIQELPFVSKPSRAKKSKKNTKRKPRKNLAVRLDVMNKNVFRAFKRNLKFIVSKFGDTNKLGKDKDLIISSFAKYTYESSYTLGYDNTELDLQTLESYIKVLVNYCQMKKVEHSMEEQTRIDDTYNVLYCYSHQKFYKYVTIPEIRVLFNTVIERLGVEEFVVTFTQANQQKYHSHVHKLTTILINKID